MNKPLRINLDGVWYLGLKLGNAKARTYTTPQGPIPLHPEYGPQTTGYGLSLAECLDREDNWLLMCECCLSEDFERDDSQPVRMIIVRPSGLYQEDIPHHASYLPEPTMRNWIGISERAYAAIKQALLKLPRKKG